MNSQKKSAFLMLAAAIFSIFSIMTVNAATISDDGEYALVLNFGEGEVDGEYSKIIKFNVEEGETTVKLSELTDGIVPFNGKNEFSHWGKNFSDDEKADEELSIADFVWSGTSGNTPYTNGLVLWAKFSEKTLQGTGTYYLTLDPFAGTINGNANLRLTSKSTEFQTVDLSQYKPVREGYTFVGWALDGEFVTSIDSSYFADRDVVTVTATYTKNAFEGDDDNDTIVLNLDANGGTIDGKSSNRYDYVGGANSGTSMSIFQYVPVREGYTFNGWNSKKDGTGKNYKYMYWAFWRNEEGQESEFDRDTLNEERGMYKNITLYAAWTKNQDAPEEPDKPAVPSQPVGGTVKELQSTGAIKANIEFADGINKDYKLDIQKVEVKKELADKNVKFIADINVMDGDSVVKISDTKMKIRIALPDDLKGYNKYEVVYILNDEIKETIPATVEDGYIVFETSHLSQYGIKATNTNTNTGSAARDSGKRTASPKTGDSSNIALWSAVLLVSCIGAIGSTIYGRRRKLNER